MKQVVFLILIALILMVAVAILFNITLIYNFVSDYLLLVVVAFILLFLIWRYDYIIMLKDYERAVIMRFGRLNRVGGPGWTLILPPLESFNRVDLRTHTIDIQPQDVVTADNIEVRIDAVIYLKVARDTKSIMNSVLEVRDYEDAAKQYVVASIRDIAGSMKMNDLISNIEVMNSTIKKKLETVTQAWGVICESVEIKDGQLPKTVIEAMHLEKAAEQQKLARMEGASAQRAEIDAVREAAETLSDKALSYYYIRALEKLGEGKSTKFIFPMEIMHLAKVLGGNMGAGSSAQTDELIKKYGPMLAEYLKSEKERRDREAKEKK